MGGAKTLMGVAFDVACSLQEDIVSVAFDVVQEGIVGVAYEMGVASKREGVWEI